MRNPQSQPPPTSVFTSKRFVVALCAAIAMVLGAMSVGVNTQSEYEDTTVTAPPSVANRAGMFARDSSRQGQAETTTPLAPSYRKYQTPIPLRSESPGINLPGTNSPTKNLEIKLKLKSLDAAITTPSAVLLLKVNNPLPEAVVPAKPTAIEPPLQGTATPTEDTPPVQTVEPNPETVPDALDE